VEAPSFVFPDPPYPRQSAGNRCSLPRRTVMYGTDAPLRSWYAHYSLGSQFPSETGSRVGGKK
jgi:hypothetical protein